MAELKVISATLLAEHNTVQITDSSISNDSIFEVYVDNPDTICNNIVVGGHTANITFDTKPSENVNIKVMVNNIDGELDLSANGITYTNDKSVSDALDELYDDINNVVDLVDERVPDDTVPGGVLYHSTTGNNWKKLNASNLDYDDNSTIYSAMGDIDTLETTSKNLVGAINEISNRPVSGAIFEDETSDNTIITWNVTTPNTYESSPIIATLPKGIYYMNLIMKSSVANVSDRAYIRVNTTNQANTYTYLYTDAHVSTEDRNNVKIHLRGIIICPNESNDISIRYNISTSASLGIQYTSSVKIGGVD